MNVIRSDAPFTIARPVRFSSQIRDKSVRLKATGACPKNLHGNTYLCGGRSQSHGLPTLGSSFWAVDFGWDDVWVVPWSTLLVWIFIVVEPSYEIHC